MRRVIIYTDIDRAGEPSVTLFARMRMPIPRDCIAHLIKDSTMQRLRLFAASVCGSNTATVAADATATRAENSVSLPSQSETAEPSLPSMPPPEQRPNFNETPPRFFRQRTELMAYFSILRAQRIREALDSPRTALPTSLVNGWSRLRQR
jgi:hypothetical protein